MPYFCSVGDMSDIFTACAAITGPASGWKPSHAGATVAAAGAGAGAAAGVADAAALFGAGASSLRPHPVAKTNATIASTETGGRDGIRGTSCEVGLFRHWIGVLHRFELGQIDPRERVLQRIDVHVVAHDVDGKALS